MSFAGPFLAFLDPQPRAERTCGFLLARLVRITLRDATKLRLGRAAARQHSRRMGGPKRALDRLRLSPTMLCAVFSEVGRDVGMQLRPVDRLAIRYGGVEDLHQLWLERLQECPAFGLVLGKCFHIRIVVVLIAPRAAYEVCCVLVYSRYIYVGLLGYPKRYCVWYPIRDLYVTSAPLGRSPLVTSSLNLTKKTPTSQGRFAKCDADWLRLSLGGRELRVLLALSLHADWRPNGLGRCYPKRDTLALTTNLQVSHVSEAVKSLADEGLITVVRLGRKNLYYVRQIGSTERMPPSDPEPFFAYLRQLGIRLAITPAGHLQYVTGSRNFNELSPIVRAIFDDYIKGLIPRKRSAVLELVAPEATP